MSNNFRTNRAGIMIVSSKALPHNMSEAVCELAALGFGQPNAERMRTDTLRHIEEADDVVMARLRGQYVGFALFKHMGDKTNLAGIVVAPDSQARGIGRQMLQTYVRGSGIQTLTAHTRNRAILGLLGEVCGRYNVYPPNGDQSQAEIALQLPGSTRGSDGVVYHVNRYGDDGLYGGADPAEQLITTRQTLKQRFVGLEDIGTALVVVAHVPESVSKP